MNFYGLTEQIPWVTQVIVTQRRRSFEYLRGRFDFIKVNKLGEFQEQKIAGKYVKMAIREQLLIDCLAHPEYCGGIKEITKALWNVRGEIDLKRLRELALRSKNVVQRRLGYLLELLRLPSIRLEKKFIGWRWLEPTGLKTLIGKSSKWGLLLNETEKELTEWNEVW